ncbi:hypothetical protein FA09DRAFT_361374 [Tilletiopsis washingtonensis]|uniref:Uncharacterized protein n=1 Tax=Tilletiopsis washingtonensis TaxID=58919 RepID=A0A316Z6Z7_9BASI|nr:hypothetical protein FA09DRAFT_361374 [Tilletiopsis washingtonensis]PWN97076.1 hypothetical protein FA09DRAFT_361374 [Tilletiopsis washingtonensis]
MSLIHPLTFELLPLPLTPSRPSCGELHASSIHELPLSRATLLHLLLASPLLAPELDEACAAGSSTSGGGSSSSVRASPLAQLLATEVELSSMLAAAYEDEAMLSALGARMLHLQGWHAPSSPPRAAWASAASDDDASDGDEYERELLAHEVLHCASGGETWVIHLRYAAALPHEEVLTVQRIELPAESDAAQDDDAARIPSRAPSVDALPQRGPASPAAAAPSRSNASSTDAATKPMKRIKVHDTRGAR